MVFAFKASAAERKGECERIRLIDARLGPHSRLHALLVVSILPSRKGALTLMPAFDLSTAVQVPGYQNHVVLVHLIHSGECLCRSVESFVLIHVVLLCVPCSSAALSCHSVYIMGRLHACFDAIREGAGGL